MQTREKKNLDVRSAAKEKGVYLWEIAAKLGTSEPTFNRWMREELNPSRKARALAAIDEIASERNNQPD